MGGNTKGALHALTAFAIFSAHDTVVKFLGGTYSPFQIIFFTALFSFPIITMMLMGSTTKGNLLPVHPWWTAARTCATVVTGISAFYAFSTLPLTQVYAIIFAAPLLITVLAIPILGETVRLRRWIAVLVGLTGVVIVLRPGTAELSLGHLAALAAACGSAFASIIVRKIGSDERSVVLLLYPLAANCILMAFALPFVYRPMPLTDMAGAAGIALLGLLAASFVISAYRNGEAAIVAPMQYSQIIWATLFGALLFDEFPDGPTILGAAIVIASGVYIVLRESRSGQSANTPVLRTRTRFGVTTTPRLNTIFDRRTPND
ncbi:DMT family transporter [Poseidonocella sedimentorum]|uniref:Permease of the drug/metabolite transporter (DMT) superfamily n=1 Tax=Poseidonocella sedimentorum TaxID=871652 RepID=A0A1I6D816_9RHOB|nr:DMT family transporter [Poseidonocella sedimentorum]SFR01563.1 Permease of the drug/metabolite transporter (DMT) superfamily [Poseidonocella sedimentorum]